MIMLTIPCPKMAAMAIARTKLGKAWNIVITLSKTSSTIPPTKPAMSPIRIPIAKAMPTIRKDISTDSLPPKSVRKSTSRPTESVPNRWPCSPGARRAEPRSVTFGSKGTKSGTANTTATKSVAIVNMIAKCF